MKIFFKLSITICLLGVNIFTAYSQTPQQNADNYLKDLVSQGKFSGAVLVAQNGNKLFCKGYAYADLSAKNTQ